MWLKRDDSDRRETEQNFKENKSMKLISKSLLAAVLTATTVSLLAQNAPQSTSPEGHRRPAPPIVAALDANKDGVIDADEIANAATALLTLDKNGDGQLTADEVRPARPEGGRGPGGPGGKGGKHGPRPGTRAE